MYCSKCGAFSNGNYCQKCGAPINAQANQSDSHINEENPPENTDFFTSVKNGKKRFDRFLGADENVKIKLSDLFSGIFEKHTKDNMDEVLISGTSKTTPDEADLSNGWTPPWVFSRVLVVLTITFVALYVWYFSFSAINAIAGMIFIGSLAVPFSLLMFFWEANIPRNISLFSILKIFFIGGTLSLVMTSIITNIVGGGSGIKLDYGGAIVVGIVEEIAKFVICIAYLKKNNTKYILNALLIGAAVGTGFAVFESAGYALVYTIGGTIIDGVQVIFLRAFLAGGGHIVWAAITSAAFVLVKRDHPFSFSYLKSQKFIILFLITVVLHAIWDMPIDFLSNIFFVQILLTVAAWFIILILFRSGISQINQIKAAALQKKALESGCSVSSQS